MSGRSAREREVGSESMVPAAVVELDGDSHERFPGPELQRGRAPLDHVADPPCPAVGIRLDPLGQTVLAADDDRSPQRSLLTRGDRHPLRAIDDPVVVGRAPVVGVARIAAVDQTGEPAQTVDREGAVGRVDDDRDRSVAEPPAVVS